MPRYLLEVIACSLEDAVAAEAGGADRLELCSRLDLQGFTPTADLVRAVTARVRIPARVMIRNNEGFQVSERELDVLERQVEELEDAGIEGIIAGFHDENGRLDFQPLDRLLARAPQHWKLTLHRAFDFAVGAAEEKLAAVARWARADLVLSADPPPATGIEFLLGGGVTADNAVTLLLRHGCRQVHIGRAARWPAETTAPVSEERVRAFRQLLAPPALAPDPARAPGGADCNLQ